MAETPSANGILTLTLLCHLFLGQLPFFEQVFVKFQSQLQAEPPTSKEDLKATFELLLETFIKEELTPVSNVAYDEETIHAMVLSAHVSTLMCSQVQVVDLESPTLKNDPYSARKLVRSVIKRYLQKCDQKKPIVV
jgi:hypothetical protein